MSVILLPFLNQQAPLPHKPLPLYDQHNRKRGNLERQTFDADYVARLTRGDAETERHFTRYFGELLLIKLRARLRSTEMVEDLRQETLFRVLNTLRNKGGLQQPDRFGAFVNSVCDIVILESLRAHSKFQQVPEDAPEPADKSDSPEIQFVTTERKALIQRALEKLSQTDQQILRMLFFEDRDKDEVCEKIGIDREYLRVRVHRALARCRSAIAKEKQPVYAATVGAK